MKGKYILFEGIDGSGKSTQIKKTVDYLSSKHIDYRVVREPGGTHISEKIREILLHKNHKMDFLTESFLFLAARAQVMAEEVRPTLEKGIHVLADRSFYTNVAYQGFARGLDVPELMYLNKIVTKDFIPDLSLIFDLPVTVAGTRMNKRGELNRFDAETIDFFGKAREGYLTLPKLYENHNINILDADRPPKIIFEDVKTLVEKYIL